MYPQVDELKEKDRQLAEKDKHLSDLRRKCTTLEIAKEKVEIDLQLARKLGSPAPPTMGGVDIDSEGVAATNSIPMKVRLELNTPYWAIRFSTLLVSI